MSRKTRVSMIDQLSVRTKILVATSVVGFAAISVSSYLNHRQIKTDLAERVLLRSEQFARSSSLAAESIASPDDLQRVIQAISAEPEVLDLIVVDATGNRIVASNHFSQVSRNCDDLFAEQELAGIEAAAWDGSESFWIDSESGTGTFVTPFKPSHGHTGAVLVRILPDRLYPLVAQWAVRSSRSQMAVIIVLLSLVALLLEIFVGRKAKRLQAKALRRWQDSGTRFSQEIDEFQELETTLANVERRIDDAILDLERLKWAVDETAVVLVCDESGKIVSVNRRFEKLIGWKSEELQGSFPPIADTELQREIRHCVRQGEVWRGELLLESGGPEKESGDDHATSPLWLDVTVVPMQTESGKPRPMWIGIDVTARRLAEAQTAALRQSTDAIIDTALDAVVTFDPRGEITAWNAQAERIFGRSKDEALGSNIVELIIPSRHRIAFAAGIYRFLGADGQNSTGTRIETEGLRADGSEFPVELSISSLYVDDQRLFAAFARDISLRKQAQTEIVRARDQAQAASRAKSEFLANMSHELRTPLTAILGYAEILEEDAKNSAAEHQEAVATIHRNGTHLLGLINDVLDLSKIEAGKMSLALEPTDVRQVANDVIDSLQVRAKAKGIGLNWNRDDLIPEWILIDPVRLRQVLMNLVGNAIKFTEVGGVALHIGTRVDLSEGVVVLDFAISDTGIGMSDSQTARLFAPFEQVDSSAGRKFGGTGLGLAISQRLTALMGGTITVESRLDEGSTFMLSIPAIETEKPISRATPAPSVVAEACTIVDRELRSKAECPAADESRPLSGLNVLLVEDGPDNQRLISFVLKKYGALVTIASDGLDALEYFGLAAHQLSSNEDLSGTNSIFDRRGKLESWGQDASIAAGGRRRTDCVDEVNDDSKSIAEFSRTPSTDVNEPFDLVLTDIQMPRMDGYALTSLLRAAGCHIPIVALTAHAMNGEREKCLAAGCDGYATKPIDRVLLLETCRNALALAASR